MSGIRYESPTGTNVIASGASRRNSWMLNYVPERDKLIDVDNVSLSGTGSRLRSDRRVSPDAIECVPFRDAAADAFEASFSNTAAATAEHVAATADTSAKIREGMIAMLSSPPARGGVAAFRRRGGGSDGVVQNKYNNDPGKLAAWLSVSHTEKAPKKKAPMP